MDVTREKHIWITELNNFFWKKDMILVVCFCMSVCLSVCVIAVEEIYSELVVNLSHLCLSFWNLRLIFSKSTLNKHLSGDENRLYFIFQSFALHFLTCLALPQNRFSNVLTSFSSMFLFMMASEHIIQRSSKGDGSEVSVPVGLGLTISHCGETGSFRTYWLALHPGFVTFQRTEFCLKVEQLRPRIFLNLFWEMDRRVNS